MADGIFPTTISADQDPNIQTNPIFSAITDGTDLALVDGSGNLQVVELNSTAILADTANMDTNLTTIAGAVSGTEMQVDIVAPLPAGTNNIGDVDVLSVIPGTGATNLGKAVDSVAGATDTGVAALAIRDDVLTTLTPVDGDYVNLRVNSTGALHVTSSSLNNDSILVDDAAFTPATSSVSAAGFFADETAPDSVDEGDIGAARMTLDRKQLNVIVDATTDSQRLAISATGNAGVNIAEQTLTAVTISATAAANTETNPIFTQTVNTAVSGTEVHDYDTASAVAAAATSNHDYTVTGTTFLLKQVSCSSSGAQKCEVLTGPVAGLVTVIVLFIPREGGTKEHTFSPPREVPITSTGTVRLTRTNRQNQAQDLYSTIEGNDV